MLKCMKLIFTFFCNGNDQLYYKSKMSNSAPCHFVFWLKINKLISRGFVLPC